MDANGQGHPSLNGNLRSTGYRRERSALLTKERVIAPLSIRVIAIDAFDASTESFQEVVLLIYDRQQIEVCGIAQAPAQSSWIIRNRRSARRFRS